MRLVIDMQGAQSAASGGRGVGRYTRELTRSLLACCRGEIEIFLALNGRLECEKTLRWFEGLIDRSHIKVWTWYPEVPPAGTGASTRAGEMFREWFLRQFEADVLWVPNFQEGWAESAAVTSLGSFPGEGTVFSTLHDVTPLLFEKDYLQGAIRPWYRRKLQYVKDSDLVLTVSAFSGEQIAQRLDVPAERIEVLLNGYDRDTFYPDREYLEIGKKEKFILYAGAAEQHKNIPCLIEAYAKLERQLRSRCRLVLVGKEPHLLRGEFLAHAAAQGLGAEELEFAGFVTDGRLRELMQRCRAFVFPAYAEGFGLPPLEAMACGAPVLAADATSLPEIVTDPQARFDPRSPDQLSALLRRVLTDDAFAASLVEEGLGRAAEFSWDRAAEKLKALLLEKGRGKKAARVSVPQLCRKMGPYLPGGDYAVKVRAAESIERSLLFTGRTRIFVDASSLVMQEYVTGIQRLVNGLLSALGELFAGREDVEVRAVYSTPLMQAFYYAVYSEGKYVPSETQGPGEVVEFHDGDLLLMADLHTPNVISKEALLRAMVLRGVRVVAVLCDLIPLQYPAFFPPSFPGEYEKYLLSVSQFSGVVSISRATRDAYERWCAGRRLQRPPFFFSSYFHLGADLGKANPSRGIPAGGEELLEHLRASQTILMVGTIEPRKRHEAVLDAAEELWKAGKDVDLVFVGRNGWQMDAFVRRMETHEQRGKRFHWLQGVSDEYLEKLYEAADGVISASLQEGYGLPLIEAAQHGKPLLLRRIPVFEEVAGEHAAYFESEERRELAAAIDGWLEQIRLGTAPGSAGIPCLSWKQSAAMLLGRIDPELTGLAAQPR